MVRGWGRNGPAAAVTIPPTDGSASVCLWPIHHPSSRGGGEVVAAVRSLGTAAVGGGGEW